ncbi:ankyrin repeat domain-containing protein [Cardinium endosymbiont of Sogatella furcifera]|uniref:ankyrin repeat domain-containing protein n=1 Tax=Cardinium endosymbiont of Sogatella furcifera TaxID=650378 RepID=UPI000E0D7704|nr:ankyrin repeat domain-containing protein [Cardinium endosymbiont of Sogatella furcifera]
MKYTAVAFAGAGLICLGLSYLWKSVNYGGNSSNMPVIYNNDTGVTTAGPFTSTNGSSTMFNGTNITHLEEVVTEAIKKGEKERWGNRTTTEKPSTTTKKPSRKPSKKPSKKPYTTTTSTTAKLSTSTTTTAKPSTTTVKPDDGVLLVKDPMVLEKRVLDDLKEHSFSEARIQYWLDKRLNINARLGYVNKQTLLMYSVENKNIEAVRSLLNKGAGVNIQSSTGQTALFTLLVDNNNIKDILRGILYPYSDIMNLLLKHGADPCIQDFVFKRTVVSMVAGNQPKDELRVLSVFMGELHKAIEKLHGTEECPAKQPTN